MIPFLGRMLLFPALALASDSAPEVSSSYSSGVMLGMIIGASIPLLMMTLFHTGNNSPPSDIVELNARNFWRHVGRARPAVVLLDWNSNNDCQEFRWNFEHVYQHFLKEVGNKILFFTLDQDDNEDFAEKFGSGIKGQPTLLWFSANSKNPVFYSSTLFEARWLISWIDRRFQKGGQSNDELNCTEQVIGKIYHWFDGYDCSEAEQLMVDETVEKKTLMGRLFSGSDASVYGEVLPEGIQCWLDKINTYQGEGLNQSDVLYDLGCGTGKVVVQMSLVTPCAKVAGIELSESRYRHGLQALARAEALLDASIELADTPHMLHSIKTLVDANHSLRLQLYKGDISKPVYMDGTHLFAASTTWPGSLMLSVVKNLVSSKSAAKTFATLRPLSSEELEQSRGALSKWKTISVAVSWQDNAPLHIYHVNNKLNKTRTQASSSVANKLKAN